MTKSFNILILFETSGALSIPCKQAGFIEFLFFDIPAYLLNLCKKDKINNFFEFILYFYD